MAGMFYSLTETAEKLGQTEDEVKQLAKEGKLREFRDGSNLLFKIEEVEGLLGGGAELEVVDLDADLEAAAPDEALAEVGEGAFEVDLEPEAEGEAPAEIPLEEEVFDLEAAPEQEAAPEMEVAPEAEPVAEGSSEFEVVEEELAEPVAEEPAVEPEEVELEPVGEAEGTSELGFAPEATGTTAEDEALVLDEEEIPSEPLAEGSEEEIFLAPESGILGAESDITDMDTALTGEGVSVLGGTDTGYDVTEDSMAETVGPAGTSTEASLEEIEDDVNLDSFGSGSGLLDLSLQADDTSLGGILDEIYTAEGGEEEGAPGEESGTIEDMTAEADHGMPEEALAAPEPVAIPMGPAVGAAAFVEAPPDTQSNMLGMLLFLPLAALLYAAIVTVAAQRQVMPSILESVQGLVWYIMGGAVVVAGIVVGASFAMGGEKTRAPKAKKAKKGKKEKAPKEKKAKAPRAKKEKKPKAAKPKKEKKPLFGKKKGK